MSKRNRDLRRTIGSVMLCIALGLIVWNVSAGLQRKRMARIYYEKIAGIVALLEEQYPEAEDGGIGMDPDIEYG